MNHLSSDLKILMQIGSANSLRYIYVNKLHKSLGEKLCIALPAYNALTGCNYNPPSYRKGKTNPFKILEKCVEYQEAFGSLTDVPLSDSTPSAFQILEKFICKVYNVRGIHQVNEARFHFFTKTYQPSCQQEKFIKKIRNFDASNLPPCKAELYQQLLRTRFISITWRNPHEKIPSVLKSNDNGCIEVEDKYDFVWFKGHQLPEFTTDVVIQPETSGDEDIIVGRYFITLLNIFITNFIKIM